MNFLSSLHPNLANVFEVRIPGTSARTVSGYFNDIGAAIEQAELEFKPQAIYVTLNPVKPELLARAVNRLKPYATATTVDADIVRRRWIFVDIDPVRPSGTSATDAEVDLATDLAQSIKERLAEAGWPDPLFGMSGNGAYLLYRIDLPNCPESDTLVSNILDNFDRHFSTDRVKVEWRLFFSRKSSRRG